MADEDSATILHDSDCAVHNEPAYPNGPCDCGAAPQPPVEGLREALKEAIDVFEGMNDDEINEELLPRLKAALFDFTPAHLPTGREHDLKTWPEFFEEVIAGRKTFEVRHNDRDYKVGDILWLREWSVTTGEYSGRETRRLVTYVMSGRCGVEKDTIIMALASPSLAAGPAKMEWRCFHCNMILKTYQEALNHFGPTMNYVPACQGDGGSWGQRLRHHVKSLLNGIDTGAVRLETDQDQTLARDLRFMRYAVDNFEAAPATLIEQSGQK